MTFDEFHKLAYDQLGPHAWVDMDKDGYLVVNTRYRFGPDRSGDLHWEPFQDSHN